MNLGNQNTLIRKYVKEDPVREIPLHIYHIHFTELVAKWTNHLKKTSAQITKNNQVAEDIVQEAFLALWENRVKLIPENPVGWLIKVVTNLSLRYLRDTNIEIRVHNALSYSKPHSITDVEEILLGKEKLLLIDRTYGRLPAQQKRVLHLSKEKGLKRDEIAQTLNLSPNTVKLHLHKAMKFMKEHIGCFALITALFICNNIFFKTSSTNEELMELYLKEPLASA